MKKFEEWVQLYEQLADVEPEAGDGVQGVQGLRSGVERYMNLMLHEMEKQAWTKQRKIEFLVNIMNNIQAKTSDVSAAASAYRQSM